MIRPILVFPEPVLRKEGERIEEIDAEIKQLAADLVETMEAADGLGLAAQQVGVAKQIAVVDLTHAPDTFTRCEVDGKPLENWQELMPLVFLNPEIEPLSEQVAEAEGCLSFPQIQAKVSRPEQILAKLTLLDGRRIELACDGLLARAIQHEADHLVGKLFIEGMSPAAKVRIRKKVKALQGGSWLPEKIEEDKSTN